MKVPVSRVEMLQPLPIRDKGVATVYVRRRIIAAAALALGAYAGVSIAAAPRCDQPDAIHMRVGEELSFGGMTIKRMR
jgi:hypothetical protein